MKNKGFTLIELLVAMAIGAVLLLMLSFMLVQGTKLFNTESDEINLKGDYQIVRNQIDELFMEAKTIVIVKNEAGQVLRIYTGNVDLETNEIKSVPRATSATTQAATGETITAAEGASESESETTSSLAPLPTEAKPITTERILTYDAATKSLYISSTYASRTSEGNLLSNMVTSFDMKINPDCLVGQDPDVAGSGHYENPVNVIVDLKMDGSQKNMNSEISVRVRNQLREVVIYTVENADTTLENATKVETIKVQ